jgi:hypothetical protein
MSKPKKKDFKKFFIMKENGAYSVISKKKGNLVEYLSERGLDISNKKYSFEKQKMSPEVKEYNMYLKKYKGYHMTLGEMLYVEEMRADMKSAIKKMKKKLAKLKKHPTKNKDNIVSVKDEIKKMKNSRKDYDGFIKMLVKSPGDVETYMQNKEILRMINNGEV